MWIVVHPQLSHNVFPMDGALVGAESHHFISGWLRFRLLSLSCHVTILGLRWPYRVKSFKQMKTQSLLFGYSNQGALYTIALTLIFLYGKLVISWGK